MATQRRECTKLANCWVCPKQSASLERREMSELDRRRFLQSASLTIAGGYAQCVFGKASIEVPKFAERPTFEPTALFLTWQRDPTTTMTVQWVGSETDGAKRPV